MNTMNYEVSENDRAVAFTAEFHDALALAVQRAGKTGYPVITVQPSEDASRDVQVTDIVTVFWSESDGRIVTKTEPGYIVNSAL